MNKSWMCLGDKLDRDYKTYAYGVKGFIDFAKGNADSSGRIRCPCRKCKHLSNHTLNLVEDHLYVNGIDQGYKEWVLHGELFPKVDFFTSGSGNPTAWLASHVGILTGTYAPIATSSWARVPQDVKDHIK